MTIRFGSVCSGIEAASVAWNTLGWESAWFSEIEKFPCAVLEHHYPNVKNLGDMTRIPSMLKNREIEAPDVLCGGTPCQAFSTAGNRESLNDDRGLLSLTFCKIGDEIDTARTELGKQPAIIFWENVPGVLSTKDNAFGCFLAELTGADAELQPSGKRWSNAGVVFGAKRTAAWRVLDAQHFGLAQQRKRVFVIASARADFNPVKVLFEFEGLRRDTPPSRDSWKDTSGSTGNGLARCITAGELKRHSDWETCTFIAQPIVFHPTQDPISNTNGLSHTVSCGSSTGQATVAVMDNQGVRRLTPVECERLQGFPDNYTRIPFNSNTAEQCSDAPRYKAIGNSWAVPVVRWIGERMQQELSSTTKQPTQQPAQQSTPNHR